MQSIVRVVFEYYVNLRVRPVDAESYMEIDSSKYYIDGLDSAHYEIPTVAGPSIKNREVFSWQANARWSVFPWLLINGQFMTEWNDGKNVSTYSMGFLSQILQDILTIRGNVSYNYRFPSRTICIGGREGTQD